MRNQRLEAFLQARFDYDTCEPTHRVRYEANLLAPAAELLAVYQRSSGQALTVEELFQITSEAYHEYRGAQVRLQQSRINRIR